LGINGKIKGEIQKKEMHKGKREIKISGTSLEKKRKKKNNFAETTSGRSEGSG